MRIEDAKAVIDKTIERAFEHAECLGNHDCIKCRITSSIADNAIEFLDNEVQGLLDKAIQVRHGDHYFSDDVAESWCPLCDQIREILKS